MNDFTQSRGCGTPLNLSTNLPERGCGCRTARTEHSGSTSANGRTGNFEAAGCTCCKASMREALRLLCCNQISDALDFDAFAFVTDNLLVGTQPTAIGEDDRDNLAELTGTFRRFSPGNCDLIDIEGTAFGPFESLLEVNQITLCSLSAIAFQVREVEAAVPPTNCCEETTESLFRQVRTLLHRELQSFDGPCGQCSCHCHCGNDNCCCTDGVLAALSSQPMNKRATLIAGLLVLQDANVLGTIGNVLVLSNEDDYRFYFVCANKVQMLA